MNTRPAAKLQTGDEARRTVSNIQRMLNSEGFGPLAVDGNFGPRTAASLRAFLGSKGIPVEIAHNGTGFTMLGLVRQDVVPHPVPWIAEGLKVFGLHEVQDRDRLAAWLRSDGRTLGDPSKLPWCGDWMETAIRNSLPSEPLPGALGENPYWARNWSLFGNYAPPGLGTILVFSRGSGGHVGVYMGEDSTHYHVLGGNQSDRVSVARIPKTRLLPGQLGSRWPRTWNEKPGRPVFLKPGDNPLAGSLA